MLGVILLYVGIVLISNGIYRVRKINDQSLVVMNLFTGGLSLILNVAAIIYGNATGAAPLWFYGCGTGLLFAFTYLYTAINSLFHLNQELYGWYSLFVAINAVVAASICFYNGYGGNSLYGLIWLLWAILWFTGFVENVLKIDLGNFVGYLSIGEGIITAWIPGFVMLLGLWQ